MKTPGAEVASWMSFAAAAPLADFEMRMNGSSRAVKLAMMGVWIQRFWQTMNVVMFIGQVLLPVLRLTHPWDPSLVLYL